MSVLTCAQVNHKSLRMSSVPSFMLTGCSVLDEMVPLKVRQGGHNPGMLLGSRFAVFWLVDFCFCGQSKIRWLVSQVSCAVKLDFGLLGRVLKCIAGWGGVKKSRGFQGEVFVIVGLPNGEQQLNSP